MHETGNRGGERQELISIDSCRWQKKKGTCARNPEKQEKELLNLPAYLFLLSEGRRRGGRGGLVLPCHYLKSG